MSEREKLHPVWTMSNPGKRAGEALTKIIVELAMQKARVILYDRKTAEATWGRKFVKEMPNDNPRD